MEPENITIKIEAHVHGRDQLHDYREIVVETTRGEVIKKLDAICADIEASFDH
jgi:hypothetical protein